MVLMSITAVLIKPTMLSAPILELSDSLRVTGVSGMVRIADFLNSVHYGEGGDAYFASRGALNELAIAHIRDNASLFGHGYESSSNCGFFPR